jgi:hypothetical protein
MSVIQVGLVDKTGKISPALMRSVAAALNIQVTRDLTQFWNVTATVMYLPDASQIPAGVWPVFLVKSLPPGEGGYHLDKHNQPYAKVIASPDSDEWTVDASHETLEMLVDPYGNRLQNSNSIKIVKGKIVDGTSQFGYLVEACDPCEADQYANPISGIALSDFITPHFYDPIKTTGTRYSFTGAIQHPRQILPGGYISWVNHETNEMQQLLWVDPNSPPTIHTLGPAQGASLRVWVDGEMRRNTAKETFRPYARKPNKALMKGCETKRVNLENLAKARGLLYA